MLSSVFSSEGCEGPIQLRAAGGGLCLPAETSLASPGRQIQLGNTAAAHKAPGVDVGLEDVPGNGGDTGIVTYNSRQGNPLQGPALSLGENPSLLPPEPAK